MNPTGNIYRVEVKTESDPNAFSTFAQGDNEQEAIDKVTSNIAAGTMFKARAEFVLDLNSVVW